MSSTVSNFKRKRGISLETLQWERASSRDYGGSSGFFSSCCGILELQQGSQGASRVAPGKSNLRSSSEGECGLALGSRQGNLVSRPVEGGISRSFSSCHRKP